MSCCLTKGGHRYPRILLATPLSCLFSARSIEISTSAKQLFHVCTNNHCNTNSFIAHKMAVFSSANNLYFLVIGVNYRIYSINRPGHLLNFWTLRVGAYSRWALIRGWALIKFSPFSASVVCLFCNKTINGNNKTRRCNKARFL